MVHISLFLRWSCLLVLALLAPASLPAGGGEIHQPLIRRRELNEPILSIHGLSLCLLPSSKAPVLEELSCGTPLRLLHDCYQEDGAHWFYVRTVSGDAGLLTSAPNRGWVNV